MATTRLAGPVVEGRARRRRWWIIVPLALVAIAAVAAVTAAVWIAQQMPRTEVNGLSASSQPLHVLVVGSDSREDLTAEERRELSTGHAEGERADTIFVMSIDGQRVALLAFPRDLWVERCDGSSGRINSAIAMADGPGCLVRTVNRLSGIPIHHYLEVTFGGFRDVVDSLGGVSMCLEEPINDRDAGIDLPAGCQHLDGTDALGYVRVRKIDDDFQRIVRQQQFFQALAQQMIATASPARPIQTVSVAAEVASAATADTELGPITMLRIAWALRSVASDGIIGATVPVTPRITGQGAYVLDPVADEAALLFSAHRTGTVFGEVAP